MTAEPQPEAGQSGQNDSADTAVRLLRERSEADIRKLVEGIKSRSTDRKLVGLLTDFQKELHDSSSRTIETFTNMPTVREALVAWTEAGVPKHDILYLLIDALSILDSRAVMGHKDQARMTSLVGGAVLAVAEVYAAAAEEGIKVREELARVAANVEIANRTSQATITAINQFRTTIEGVNQANYELVQMLGVNVWKGRLYLGLGAAALVFLSTLGGILVAKVFL